MCGFVGVFTNRDERRSELEQSVRRMMSPIVHRGPDDAGTWHDAEAGIGLGFRRLAILDLSPNGHQPMASASGRFTLVFNGEVYNHGDLRRELSAAGHTWRGHSDTEVILAAFEAWGVGAAVRRFVGMFAMAVWDRQERALTLIRDRLGKKPLFVYRQDGLILFGSELKALDADPDFRGEVDPASVAQYLRYLYIPAPGSIYRNVRKLPPAHLLTVRDAAAPLPDPTPYWSAETAASAGRDARPADEREALDRLGTLLEEATRIRLESDVPLGALLSGGIDSSLVVAVMQSLASRPVRTFTIGFDEAAYDESAHAAAVASHLGTEHTTLPVTGADALAVVPDLPTMFDEPHADPSQIPTALVCRLARRDVTVALCGDGGDEVFGGYNRYLFGPRTLARTSALPAPLRRAVGRSLLAVGADTWDAFARPVTALLPAARRPRLVGEKLEKLGLVCAAASDGEGYRTLMSAWQRPEAVVPGTVPGPDALLAILARHPQLAPAERMMLADQVTYLPDDLLAKIDRASMAYSLEVRAPLLDHRVVEFAWTLPERMKLRDGTTKWALRELLARHVPRAMFERPKMGFSVPLRAWLTGGLRPWAEDLLSERSLRDVPVLDAAAVRRTWTAFLAGRTTHGLPLWAVLQLIAWWRRWTPLLAAP